MPTRVNISKSTIPIYQVYLGERELERGAYGNLQQAGRLSPGLEKGKRDRQQREEESNKNLTTSPLISS